MNVTVLTVHFIAQIPRSTRASLPTLSLPGIALIPSAGLHTTAPWLRWPLDEAAAKPLVAVHLLFAAKATSLCGAAIVFPLQSESVAADVSLWPWTFQTEAIQTVLFGGSFRPRAFDIFSLQIDGTGAADLDQETLVKARSTPWLGIGTPSERGKRS